MKKLLLSETFMVLLLRGNVRPADLCLSECSAGIVLGGIYDLLEAGCVAVQAGGHLRVTAPLPDRYQGLSELYEKIMSSSQNTGKLLDYYCCSSMSKNIGRLLDGLYSSVADKSIIHIECRRGLLGKKRVIRLCEEETVPVINDFLKKTEQEQLEESAVFCIKMLQLAGALKRYFPKREGKTYRVLGKCEHTEMWKCLKPYVNRIENFNYQNTVNSGAI